MGYLVKASFNAEPRAYALEGIRTDVDTGILPAMAMARHEKQDFWYPVSELLGESPTPSFRYLCGHCKSWLAARKIDVGLQTKCGQCGQMFDVPDVEARQRDVSSHDAPKQVKALMIAGALVASVGIISTVASYFSAVQAGTRGYSIFTGLIILGLGTFHQGWSRSSQIRRKPPLDRK
ncbi:hypothetical protein [Prosthecobacter sp.]|uniref:hypothetical protein n=1 Tax=Prosthecobacter sp. TaxID=1965333 RepID=UPI0037843CF8